MSEPDFDATESFEDIVLGARHLMFSFLEELTILAGQQLVWVEAHAIAKQVYWDYLKARGVVDRAAVLAVRVRTPSPDVTPEQLGRFAKMVRLESLEGETYGRFDGETLQGAMDASMLAVRIVMDLYSKPRSNPDDYPT